MATARRGAVNSYVQRRAGQLWAVSPVARARAVQRYVQGLPYVPDPPGSYDLVSECCQTMVVGGDCEDLATLAVSLDFALGLRAVVRWMYLPRQSQDHVSSLVELRGVWRWQETTVAAGLGEPPLTASGRLKTSLVT